MRDIFHSKIKPTRSCLFSTSLLMSLLLSLPFVLHGQTQPAQLSLADILIGLRSKKVTLAERNTLLTGAVKTRGITFGLTPEIEKELVSGGAGIQLVEAIRQKSPKTKVAPITLSKSESTPISTSKPTPTPIPTAAPIPIPGPPKPDATFYRVRANSHIVKAEYELAVADYGKWIELSPKDSTAYFNRGDSYEKMGNVQKAVEDYRKAVELDANNEPAKNNLQRLQAGQPKTSPKPQNKETASISGSPAVSQTVELGELNGFAVNLVTPVYPEIAKKMNAQGKVTVQITLDKEGNVVLSKAVAGHTLLRSSGEEAARKSKFKPARVGNQAVKATGFIIYNFIRQAS